MLEFTLNWYIGGDQAKKGGKENVYNYHLRTCPNVPPLVADDRELNEKIDEIIERHAKLKAEKKKLQNAFTCPYCQREYKGENLRHLLGCAKKNPGDEQKLKNLILRKPAISTKFLQLL